MRYLYKFIMLVGLVSYTANAQFENTVYVPPYNPGLQLLNDSIKTSDDADSDDTSTADVKIEKAALNYTISRSYTAKNLQNIADKTRATDPAQADKMEALFASTDIMGLMGDAMQSVGLSRNNAADAFAVYWVSAWQAANGRTDTPNADTFKAVAVQAARGLSQSQQFKAANDRQKQEMAEALMLQAALIDGSIDEAASDRTKQKAVAKAVLQGAKASGLELDKMTLTEEGFVEGSPRKGADASSAAQDNDTKLASNDRGDDNDETTSYALIAAAAGAGLGGVFLLGKAMTRRG